MANECPKCQTDNPDESKFCMECATPLPQKEEIVHTKTLETSKEELTTGSIFAGRYKIIEELGKGGMGKVYRVFDQKLNEEVALKLIRPDIAADKKTIERFKNELKLARKISQKNVGRMYEFLEDRDTRFITMEYISGQDLKGLIRQTGQLTVGKAISIAKQICEGLAEAHSLGVVHRDLKPNNIMIDRGGNAKILDFGIARAVKGKGITGSGVAIGTPQYMSPEQIEGKDVDLRSDIYSLGIVLYEMLTDRVPFEGDTPLTVGVKQKTETPKDPNAFNERIPQELSRLILKCLEKEKEGRYQSADELRSDLEKLEQGLPTSDRVVPRKKSLTSKEITVQLSLKKLLIPVFAVIAVLLIGLILWHPWSAKKSAAIPADGLSLAIVYFENNTGDESMENWRKALAELIIDDLSQSRLVKILSVDRLYSLLKRQNLLEAKSFSSEDLKNIAEQAGAKNILWGNFQRAGETIRINSRIMDVGSGQLLGTQSIDSQGEEGLFTAVDGLTLQIKKSLNFTSQEIANDRDKEIGTITTSSPEAYKYYVEGRSLIRERLQTDKVVNYMERAVSIDPDFAMAYRCLAMMSNELGDNSKAREYIKKAFELKDKLSEAESHLIMADYHMVYEENYDDAVEAYKNVLQLQPDNWVANNNLARIYNLFEEFDKALELYETNRNYGDDHVQTYDLAALCYWRLGKYEKAIEVLDDYLKKFSDNTWIHTALALAYSLTGKYEYALIEAERAFSSNPWASLHKGRIRHLKGDFEAAEKDYRSLLEMDNTAMKMYGWRWLEHLYRMLGQYERANQEAQTGLEYAKNNNLVGWERAFLRLLAFNDLRKGDLEAAFEWAEKLWENAVENESITAKLDALRIKIIVALDQNMNDANELAEEVKKIVDSTPSKKDIRWYYLDLGLIEMEKKNYSKAVDFFAQAYKLQAAQSAWYEYHAYILYNLASAYYLNGDMEAAQKEYENILALTTGRLVWGDLYVKSFYQLGKIHEESGNKTQAIEHYKKFLDLWKDADPGLPEVDDAKKRLAGLA